MKFYELAIGARFTHRGQRFTKLAMSCARDERGWGNVFQGSMEVEPEGEPLLLSPEEAARWKPDDGDWTRHLTPAGRPMDAESEQTPNATTPRT